jgi:hypothetical protein
MGAQITKAAILVLVASALIWIGIAFAGFALLTALTPALGLAGAAAIVAALLLLGPLGALVALLIRRPARPAESALGDGGNHELLMAVLGAISRNKPLIAVATAGLLGIVEMLFRKRKP